MTTTKTTTARTITVGTVLAPGETVSEIDASIRRPGCLTFLLAADGACSAKVVEPNAEIEVQA